MDSMENIGDLASLQSIRRSAPQLHPRMPVMTTIMRRYVDYDYVNPALALGVGQHLQYGNTAYDLSLQEYKKCPHLCQFRYTSRMMDHAGAYDYGR